MATETYSPLSAVGTLTDDGDLEVVRVVPAHDRVIIRARVVYHGDLDDPNPGQAIDRSDDETTGRATVTAHRDGDYLMNGLALETPVSLAPTEEERVVLELDDATSATENTLAVILETDSDGAGWWELEADMTIVRPPDATSPGPP